MRPEATAKLLQFRHFFFFFIFFRFISTPNTKSALTQSALGDVPRHSDSLRSVRLCEMLTPYHNCHVIYSVCVCACVCQLHIIMNGEDYSDNLFDEWSDKERWKGKAHPQVRTIERANRFDRILSMRWNITQILLTVTFRLHVSTSHPPIYVETLIE